MSKRAEEAALKAYPQEEIVAYGPLPGADEPNVYDDDLPYRTGFIKGYEQAQKDFGWISVKERLPENADYVLTCVDVDGVPQCIGLGYYSNDAGVWIDPFDEKGDADNVDYWMPIPELPKEK